MILLAVIIGILSGSTMMLSLLIVGYKEEVGMWKKRFLDSQRRFETYLMLDKNQQAGVVTEGLTQDDGIALKDKERQKEKETAYEEVMISGRLDTTQKYKVELEPRLS